MYLGQSGGYGTCTNGRRRRDPRFERACVSEADVRATLARILESADFSRSRRVGGFLRFVVEEKVAGRGERLKAFAIA